VLVHTSSCTAVCRILIVLFPFLLNESKQNSITKNDNTVCKVLQTPASAMHGNKLLLSLLRTINGLKKRRTLCLYDNVSIQDSLMGEKTGFGPGWNLLY
jgi:hypothetical protein